MKRCILSNVVIFLFFSILSINCHRIKVTNTIEDHLNEKDHDPSIDHKSFLGVEESKTFDKLLPEESKERLKKLIISKVDINGDRVVSIEELKAWITHIANLTKENERDEYFPIFKNSSDALLDYDTYLNKIYGGLSVDELDDVSKQNLELMHKQDERKWKAVDKNQDNKLDRFEFLVFQHPEDYPSMKTLVVQETMEISDKNKDGYLDLQEYISDIWPPTAKERPEPELVKQEEDTFAIHRDINRDGKLDRDEVGQWLMPTDYDSVDAETRHLMHNADSNEDSQLSLDEILESYDVFVGSQVTDYGNSLKHEEL